MDPEPQGIGELERGRDPLKPPPPAQGGDATEAACNRGRDQRTLRNSLTSIREPWRKKPAEGAHLGSGPNAKEPTH